MEVLDKDACYQQIAWESASLFTDRDMTPEFPGVGGEGRVNGGSIDVDFNDDALYARYAAGGMQ